MTIVTDTNVMGDLTIIGNLHVRGDIVVEGDVTITCSGDVIACSPMSGLDKKELVICNNQILINGKQETNATKIGLAILQYVDKMYDATTPKKTFKDIWD